MGGYESLCCKIGKWVILDCTGRGFEQALAGMNKCHKKKGGNMLAFPCSLWWDKYMLAVSTTYGDREGGYSHQLAEQCDARLATTMPIWCHWQ